MPKSFLDQLYRCAALVEKARVQMPQTVKSKVTDCRFVLRSCQQRIESIRVDWSA